MFIQIRRGAQEELRIKEEVADISGLQVKPADQ